MPGLHLITETHKASWEMTNERQMFPEANFDSRNPTSTLVSGSTRKVFLVSIAVFGFSSTPFLRSDWLQWSGYLACLKSSLKQRRVGEHL